MTDHHQAACEAATLALAEARDRGEVGAHALAHAAVEAAAPHVAAAERERIAALAESAEAVYLEFCGDKPYCPHGDHTRPFADLIRNPEGTSDAV